MTTSSTHYVHYVHTIVCDPKHYNTCMDTMRCTIQHEHLNNQNMQIQISVKMGLKCGYKWILNSVFNTRKYPHRHASQSMIVPSRRPSIKFPSIKFSSIIFPSIKF